MELVRVRHVFLALLLAAGAFASQSWINKDPVQWTSADLQKILNDSPWAQQVMASFGKPLEPEDMPVTPPPGAPATGIASARGATDGRWDGGIARNTGVGESPSLPVTVRWDSAMPVRQALSRSDRATSSLVEEHAAGEYILTVLGLVPANTAASPEHPANDPAQIEGFLANSRLMPRGEPAIAPENARIDGATGAVYLFFPRTRAIRVEDKEITFLTRFGSVRVQKKFRLKEMMYKGRLEL